MARDDLRMSLGARIAYLAEASGAQTARLAEARIRRAMARDDRERRWRAAERCYFEACVTGESSKATP